MSKLVVLRRCATIEDAFIVDSLLQDGGFLSSTPVRYHAQNEWWSVHAFNGIPVFIPEVELVEAAEYLIEMRASAKERLEEKFGEIDPTPWKRRPIRRWSLLAKEAGLFHLLWLPIAWVLSLIPSSLFSSQVTQELIHDGSILVIRGFKFQFSWPYYYWLDYLSIYTIDFVGNVIIYAVLIWTMIRFSRKQKKQSKTRMNNDTPRSL